MKFNVAIIGSGKMASSYIEVLKKNRKFNILGAYSRNKKNLKLFCEKNAIKSFNNIDEIKNNKSLDLLIVAVTATSLIRIISYIFNIKCKVLLEKPLGINFKEAEIIFRKIVLKKNFFLALNRRYYGSTLIAKKFLSNKRKIIFIDDHINFDPFKKLGFNLKNKKYFVYSHSIHLIDYLKIFGNGKIINIDVKKTIINNKLNIFCLLEFKSGDIGIYNATYNSACRWKIIISNYNYKCLFQPLEKLFLTNKTNLTKDYSSYLDKRYKPGIWNLVNDVKQMLHGKNHSLVSLKDGLSLMKLINRIHY